MTTTIKVHTNGNYLTTIVQTVEGEPGPRTPVEVRHGEEKHLYFRHGAKNTFVITEEYLGDVAKPAPEPSAA